MISRIPQTLGELQPCGTLSVASGPDLEVIERMEPCKTVLIVEDDKDIRQTLSELLEIEGYSVRSAEHGKQALEILKHAERPCLILLDLMMPVMSGWEFLEMRKTSDALFATIPVVVVSAAGERDLKTADAAGYVKKPVDLEVLLGVVHRYCGLPGAQAA